MSANEPFTYCDACSVCGSVEHRCGTCVDDELLDAAPELLEALDAFVKEHDRIRGETGFRILEDELFRARYLIAKAKGEV